MDYSYSGRNWPLQYCRRTNDDYSGAGHFTLDHTLGVAVLYLNAVAERAVLERAPLYADLDAAGNARKG